MSRKKAVRVKKKKIKNQMENAAEETVTVETEETAEQEAAGQSPSAETHRKSSFRSPRQERNIIIIVFTLHCLNLIEV